MREPTAEQWAEIDAHILDCNILRALLQIRAACEIGLHDAKIVHWDRYQELRERRPTEFACSHEDYWRDVYG